MDLRNSSKQARAALECRAASADEYSCAAQLRQEMSLETGAGFDELRADWRTKFCAYFAGKQAVGEAQLFLACDGDEPAGCAIVSVQEHYRRYVFGTANAYVNAVYVRPAYRRRGAATRLMQLVVAWARERGCSNIRLRASNDGRFLYERLGFRQGREMELDL